MLDRFPKTRRPLPLPYQRIYAAHYRENRDGASQASSIAQRLERWMHRAVARDTVRDTVAAGRGGPTLEIGAGTLNHLRYEPKTAPYDIVEPFTELYASSPQLARIRRTYQDIRDIPETQRYERIIAIATFEHICDLPEVVDRAARLLADDGELRVAIPSEGTVLWTLAWKLTTGVEFKFRHGLDYGVLMRHEHVNTAAEIRAVLEHFFVRVSSTCLGLTPRLSLYQFFACSGPRRKRLEKLAFPTSLPILVRSNTDP